MSVEPKPAAVAVETARRAIEHVTDARVTVSLTAGTVAGLLAVADELARMRAEAGRE